jgi:hypothetical protein
VSDDSRDTSYLSLREAVDRWKRESGSSNAYDWYRKQAHRDGRVWFGGPHLDAWKVGNQWVVGTRDLEAAITARREERARIAGVTADYERRVLHDGGGTQLLNWGGYRISGSFHLVWNDQAVARRDSDGSWYCNTCWKSASLEYNGQECHTCSDWGGCGGDCTLSAVCCLTCGTSLATRDG